ncbi:tyrosine-protein phosphatase [Stigmatella sp. ncwal1]|uniref:Tyrosine-protein phosphatase n=1 Tax=Stigmatella ashevillensis TaxID=2995309 RepID=A0ABT5DC12_9BACT|nr:tyrosine-protein phosphatase [Stigmatella ashevillena]MDC0711207.1 tyrosine-protein phosphatase [Stigmatella ashevillena]
MKYVLTFGVQALLLGGWALHVKGVGLLLLWPALSLLLVALAYAGAGARIFGKQPDGTLRLPALVALLPYLLLTWGVWHLARVFSREPPYAEVVPGLFIGRRLLPGELPPHISTVLDLTAEFIEPRDVREACRYRALPILDASTLPLASVVPVLRELAGLAQPLYVHCAQGHGRTGMIAAALLVARRQAPDVPTALALVQRARPGVRLSRAQTEALKALAVALHAGATQP